MDIKIVDGRPKTLEEIEIAYIFAMLKYFNYDKNKTAQALGVSRATLYRRIK